MPQANDTAAETDQALRSHIDQRLEQIRRDAEERREEESRSPVLLRNLEEATENLQAIPRIREELERGPSSVRAAQDARAAGEPPSEEEAAELWGQPLPPPDPVVQDTEIPDYLSSETLPRGYQFTPEELERLANTGAGGSGTISGPADAWRRGRIQAQRGRFQSRPILQQAMSQRVVDIQEDNTPEQTISRVTPRMNARRLSSGRQVYDPRSWERAIRASIRAQELHKRGWTNQNLATTLTAAQRDELNQEVDRRTHITMAQISGSGQGRVWADSFDRNRNADLAEFAKIFPPITGPIAVVRAYMSPAAFGTMQEMPENPTPAERAHFRQSRMQWDRENLAFSFARMMMGSYFATRTTTGEWISEDTFRMIREGDDILYHSPEFVGGFSRLLGDEPGEISAMAKIGGYGGLAFLTLFGGDAVALLGTAGGVLHGTGATLSRVRQLGNLEDALSDIAARVPPEIPATPIPGRPIPAEPRMVPKEGIQELREAIGHVNLGAQRVVSEIQAVKVNSNAHGAARATDILQSRIATARDAVARAEERVATARVQGAHARANQDATLAVQELNAARLEEARLAEVDIEARKIVTLEALGISEEAAAGIRTVEDYVEAMNPNILREAEEAFEEATAAQKELLDIYYNPARTTDLSAEPFIGDQLAARSREFMEEVGAGGEAGVLSERAQRLREEINALRGQMGEDQARLMASETAVRTAAAQLARIRSVPNILEEAINIRAKRAMYEGLVTRGARRVDASAVRAAAAKQTVSEKEAALLLKEEVLHVRQNARASFQETVVEVRDSIRALREGVSEEFRIGANLRAEARALGHIRGFPKRLRHFGQAIRTGTTKSGDYIKRAGLRVDPEAVARDFQGLETSFVRSIDKKTGEVTVNRTAIEDYLVATLGKDGLEEIDRFDPKGVLRFTVRNQPTMAEVKLTPQNWRRTREALNRIHGNRARQLVERKETLWARSIATAWRDLGLLSPKQQQDTIYMFTQHLRHLLQRKDAHTAFESKFGFTLSEEVTNILRATENAIGRFQRELMEAPGIRALAPREVNRIINYIDLREPVVLAAGRTRFAELFDSGTIFDNAKRQILADTRANPRIAQQLADRGDSIRAKIVSTLTKELRALKVPKAEFEALTKAAGNMSDDIVSALFKSGATTDLADTAISKPLLALSRMFLSKTTMGPLSGTQQAVLVIRARSILAKSNTFREFVDGMEKFSHAYLGRMGAIRVKHASDAAIAQAYQKGASAMGAASSIGYAAQKMERLYLMEMTAETAADINKILTGSPGVKDAAKAFAALNDLGFHAVVEYGVKPGILRVSGDRITKITKELIEVGTTKGGTTFFPRALVESFEKEYGKIINSIDAVTPHPWSQLPVVNLGVKTYKAQLSLWRQSVVTGMIIPNPRYWTNNIAADAMQVYQEAGILFSVRGFARNLSSNIPGHAWWSNKKEAIMAAAVRNKYGDVPVLPGIFESLFDSDINKIFMGREGHFLTKGGQQRTFSEIRQWALEDGILEDFVHEELLLTLKYQSESWLSGNLRGVNINANKLNRTIGDHAGTVQQRQRLGLYFDLISRGATRTEARKRTLRALYDWKHGIAKQELALASSLIPFYRFWKLAIRQQFDALLEPIMRAPSEVWTDPAVWAGQTRLKRMQNQILLAGHAGVLTDPETEDDAADALRQMDLFSRSFLPRNAEGRIIPTVGTMTQQEIDDYQRETGIWRTHWFRSTPPITANVALNMLLSMGLVANSITGILEGNDPGDTDIGKDRVGDWEAALLEPFLQTMHPWLDTLSRAGLSMAGVDLEYAMRSGSKTLNPNEEEAYRVLRASGLGLFFTEAQETDDGRYEIPWTTYMLWKSLPFIGNQPQRWVAGYQAYNREDDPGRAMLEALGAITGAWEKKYFDPQREMDSIMYAMWEQYQKIMQSFPPLPGDSPSPRDLPTHQEVFDR